MFYEYGTISLAGVSFSMELASEIATFQEARGQREAKSPQFNDNREGCHGNESPKEELEANSQAKYYIAREKGNEGA
jgi:hypothetical protein